MMHWEDPRAFEVEDPEREYGLDYQDWLRSNPRGTFAEFHAHNARVAARINSERVEVRERESGLMAHALDLARSLARGLRRAL